MPAATTDLSGPLDQMTALPEEILLAAESQWLFTEEELRRTPSIIDGLSPEKERENRSKGVNFIAQVGIMLKLPQITLATASTFLHRFYMRYSMESLPGKPGHHYYSMAATSLFLATKVEENCRKMKDLVIACVRVAQKDPYKMVDEQDKEYWKWRDNILLNEDLLLEAICFDLRLEPPYKILHDLLHYFRAEDNKRLRNAAWAFISDSCLTPLCLLFPSSTIATSALYAAARHSGTSFPDDEIGRPWWEVVGTSIEDIGKACDYMAEVYQNTSSKGRENGLYGKTIGATDGSHDTTRLVSPSNRNDSPTEESQGSLKRGAEDSLQNNGNTDGGAHRANGTTSGSPRKRQRVGSDNQQFEDMDSRGQDDGVEHSLPMQQRPPETTATPPSGTADANKVPEAVGGLISPKLDNGSEEGEVDA